MFFSEGRLQTRCPFTQTLHGCFLRAGQAFTQPQDKWRNQETNTYFILLSHLPTLFRIHTCPNNVVLVDKQTSFSPAPGSDPGLPAVFSGPDSDIFVDSEPLVLEIVPFGVIDVSWNIRLHTWEEQSELVLVWAQSILYLGLGIAEGPLHPSSGLPVGTPPSMSTQIPALWNFLFRGPSLGSWLGTQDRPGLLTEPQ